MSYETGGRARGRTAHHGRARARSPSASIIGRSSEFFDFFVYAIASVLVFPRVMFPFAEPLDGDALVLRDLRARLHRRGRSARCIFMAIDRRWGRGVKLTLALFLLGCSTAGIAFMPDYSVAGVYAIVILAVMRIAQGIALGGTWDGLPSLLAMNAPENERGWYAMIPQLGAPVGLFVASALFVYLITGALARRTSSTGAGAIPSSSPSRSTSWRSSRGCGSSSRRSTRRSSQSLELQPTPVRETLAAEGVNILIGAFTPLATFALFHMVTVFPLSWVYLTAGEQVPGFLGIEIGTAVLGLAAIIASGALADRIGRRRLLDRLRRGDRGLRAGGAGAARRRADRRVRLHGGRASSLLGLSFGQSSGAVASRFSRRYRYTASALTSDLAWMFGAGFAPLVALFLATRFGLFSSGVYLLSGAICTLIALLLSQRLDLRND